MTAYPPGRDDGGFSLVELLVVVVILAILLLVGLPTLRGASESANNRAVQSNVRSAFAATRVFYNDHRQYSDDPAVMRDEEPTILWTNDPLTASSTERTVRIRVYDEPDDDQTVVVAGRTSTGHCFYLRDVMGGETAGTYFSSDVKGSDSCPTPDPADITARAWG